MALPVEILQKIFKHVRRIQSGKRVYRQYLCTYLYVNRSWCSVAVPLLWDKPLEYAGNNAHAVVEACLGTIDDDEREALWFQNIPAPKRRALFNYTCFLQELDVDRLRTAVEEWLRIKSPQKWSATQVQMVMGLLCQKILTQATLSEVKVKEEGLTPEECQLLTVLFAGNQHHLSYIQTWFSDAATVEFAALVATVITAQLGHVRQIDLARMVAHMDLVLAALKQRSSEIHKVSFVGCDLQDELVLADLKELSKQPIKVTYRMCLGVENS